jgi:AcrR family transcriptional regulator
MPADERREQLMDAALDILVSEGYRAVSIEAIVRALDVTRPVFYNVFPDLDALLQQLLDRTEKRALEQLMSTIAVPGPDDDPGAYLRNTVRALVAMIRDDPRTWTPIFVATADTPEAVRRRVARDREVIRQRFAGFAAGMARARPDIDPDVVAHALVAVGEYFARLILEDPSSVDADRLASTLASLFG